MCGIAGFLGGWGKDDLKGLGDRLAWRGPDGEGFVFEKAGKVNLGLAHRRLSIIDLSEAAAQPMVAVNDRYVVVFNGEIYNFRALVKELLGKAYSFNANSDTAVLGPLYDWLGVRMLERLDGSMFAFAIYDRESKELFCARDAVGVKPFYYTVGKDGFAFASEMKALAGLVDFGGPMDLVALREYLTFGWTPGERTLVPAVRKLRPGHWLKVKADGSVETGRWYRAPLPQMVMEKPLYNGMKTPEQLRALLLEIVRDQCVADVPVGAFLSGGVDSSAVVALMRAAGVDVANTYCIGFEGQGMEAEGFGDDLVYARMMAQRAGVKLSEVRVDARGMLEDLPKLAWMLDEPQADPAPLLVKKISEVARGDGLKLLMSGTGGDDVMSGYRRHLAVRLKEKLGWMRPGAEVAKHYVKYVEGRGALGRRVARMIDLLAVGDEDFLLEAFMTNMGGDAADLFAPPARHQLGDWDNALVQARGESRGQDLLNRMLDMELHGFLPDHNFNYSDKASMAAGVEVRVPLTDRRLIAWMADVPPEKKLAGTRLKAFFKDAMSKDIPPEILNRSKAGFGAPVRSWLVNEGRGLVEATLFGQQDSVVNWGLDAEAVRKLWDDTLAGRADGAYRILGLCMVGWWRNKMIEERGKR